MAGVRNFVVALLLVAGLLAVAVVALGGFALSGTWLPKAALGLCLVAAFGLVCLVGALRMSRLTDADQIRASVAVCALVAVTAVVCLVVLEVAIAFLRPAMTYKRAKRSSAPIFVESDFLPFELKPGYSAPTYIRETGETIDFSVNELGYRGRTFDVQKAQGVYRIVVLGDSFATNVAVSEEHLYTVLLEQQLNRAANVHCQVEVINAGYASGYSPDAYVAYMLERGFELSPDLVIMQYFVLNDFKDLLETEVLAMRDDLPVRVHSRSRYVDEEGRFRRRFLFNYRAPVLRNSHLFQHLWHLFDMDDLSLRIARLVVPKFAVDNFSPVADGIRPEQVYAAQAERPRALREAFDRSLDYVRGLARESRRRGVEFLLFLVPTGVQASPSAWSAEFPGKPPEDWDDPNPQAEIVAALGESGLDVWNPLDAYREGARREVLFLGEDRNGHWNAAGNAFTAELLASYLTEESQPFRRACVTE